MANNASSPTPSATLVLPPRLPLAQPLLPPFSFPSEPIFPIPHPAPIYGHPFRLPLMVSASKPKANERETRLQGLQPPVPTTALLPSQTAFEHRFTTSSLRNGPQGCVKQEEGGSKPHSQNGISLPAKFPMLIQARVLLTFVTRARHCSSSSDSSKFESPSIADGLSPNRKLSR